MEHETSGGASVSGSHELKLAPAAGLKLIRYRDLVRIEGDPEKVRDLFFRDGGKEKKLKLRLDAINSEDCPRLIVMLEQKIHENDPPTAG